MSIDYTTDNLLQSINLKLLGLDNQQTYNDTRLIAMANEEQYMYIVPRMRSVNEDYFTKFIEYPILPEKSAYPLPQLSSGMTLRFAMILNPTQAGYKLPQLTLEDIPNQQFLSPYPLNYGYIGFYFMNNNVVLFPRPTQTSPNLSLRLYYAQRPNKLVSTVNGAQITNIDYDTKELTVVNYPQNWMVGTKICFIDSTPGFDTIVESTEITNIAGNVITVADIGPLPAEQMGIPLEIGDWICLEGESTIPQIPVEAHPILAQATVVQALQGLGDPQLNVNKQRLDEMMEFYLQSISPRDAGNPKKITTAGSGLSDYVGYSCNPRLIK